MKLGKTHAAAALIATGLAVAGAARAHAAATIVPLVNFAGPNGSTPALGLTADAAGDLFGCTLAGGASGSGTAYELAAGTHAFSTVASFPGGTEAQPQGGLLRDPAGNLYGTTNGAGTVGTVFRLAVGASVPTVLATFNASTGVYPNGELVADAGGNLYGTADSGGAAGAGTVFRVDPTSGAVTVLASFPTTAGYPETGLRIDAAGNLYGATRTTVFEVPAGATTVTTIAAIPNASATTDAFNSLTLDPAGNLYGVAEFGGPAHLGAVFRVDAVTRQVTTVASLSGPVGSHAEGGVTIDAVGDLFGTTTQDAGSGSVYEVAAGSNTATVVAPLTATTGFVPTGELVADAAGNLYGTAMDGGANGDGTVFEVTGSGFVVPEPATAAVLVTAGLPAVVRRRRVTSGR